MSPTRILIVEDDMIIAANISLQLSKLGYEVTGIETKGEEAIHHALESKPDIILMDIHLKGKTTGIDAAHEIHRFLDIPLIFLTANEDDATFEKAKETHPFAFISKPFTKQNLERTIALVRERIKETSATISFMEQGSDVYDDRIFIRNHNKLIKVMLDDILWVEAERNYCKIITAQQSYMIVSPLNKFCDKIDPKRFVRIHRSFMVNFSKLDAVTDSSVELKGKLIPIGKQYKEDLLRLVNKV
ncbi:LytTR family two component transcriptional regulator [Algoriphagus ratkowskyi]|uniref:LytTR family two component transcriptional regulator n=1 Tax=Algoriphagus ratkowskyi TaxID=57028 RepID=A0A2W7R6C5_9BACT|nr:response regulator [Algoriphagus ratkowskyi]PZX56014.1 LytTR family two component transcriptional regulator [Algoriphagus ratkowskyi]TXD77176.1 response regulator [Algoriphagus ratkowskyi]